MILQDSIDPALLQSFIDGYDERSKKKMTQRSIDMLVRKLSRLEQEGHCPNLLLEKSIIGGWKDVYPCERTMKAQSFISVHADKSWADNVVAIGGNR